MKRILLVYSVFTPLVSCSSTEEVSEKIVLVEKSPTISKLSSELIEKSEKELSTIINEISVDFYQYGKKKPFAGWKPKNYKANCIYRKRSSNRHVPSNQKKRYKKR